MKTEVFGTTVYLSDRDKETLIRLLEEISHEWTWWGDGTVLGAEIHLTPRGIGFAKKFLKDLKKK